jgi:two-component system cell cycle sensor histidine kinase/response regulator CckA
MLRVPNVTIRDEVATMHGPDAEELVRMREQLAELRSWLDTLPLATAVKDRQGRILYINAAAAAGYGHSEKAMLGAYESDFLPPGNNLDELLAHDRDVIDSGRSLTLPGQRFRTFDGRDMVLHMTRDPVRCGGERAVLITAADVTRPAAAIKALRQIERRLAETQRLDGLGLMAGGIAHDFNNLLVGVLANAELALRELASGTTAAALLQRVKAAAERMAGLTRQLLAYSGRGHVQIEIIDLPALARESLALVSSGIPATIRVVTELPEGLHAVQGDRAQLTQVIMNFLINAAEAIGGRPGTIHLSTRVEFLDPHRNASLAVRSVHGATDHLCLEVRDDGPGMDESTRNRIFDPFFSTKSGSGRGLGLASVLGIVRAHQGALQVDSEPGAGTRMRVWLPLAQAKARAKRTPLPRVNGEATRGRVLVVDDEQVVRDTTAMILHSQGFVVDAVADGDRAVQAADGQPYDLVLLDMTMPGRSVTSTYHALRERLPSTPILLTSGYGEPATLNELLEQPATEFVQKPFSVGDLSERIKRLVG